MNSNPGTQIDQICPLLHIAPILDNLAGYRDLRWRENLKFYDAKRSRVLFLLCERNRCAHVMPLPLQWFERGDN